MAHVRRRYAPRVLRHRSLNHRRIEFSQREHAFATEWEHENKPTRGCGLGEYGMLQALMVDQRSATADSYVAWWRMPVRFWITNKEAAIAATVVQWLGTNVGLSFLTRCLKACGYRIVRDEQWSAAPDCCPICHGRGRKIRIKGVTYCGWCRLARYPWHRWDHVEERSS